MKIYLKNSSFWRTLHLDIILLFFILLLLGNSVFLIWSANGQDIYMMEKKIKQIFMGFLIMLILAQISPKIYELWAPFLYLLCIFLLSLTLFDSIGEIRNGAQRWLKIGFIHFQPSEVTKITVPLMIARYINRDRCPPTLMDSSIALILIFIPTLLVAIQPDLGTAVLIAISGLFVLFLGGISWKFIIILMFMIIILIPILWFFFMHDYQRRRIFTLFHPEDDPLGTGYHITQSKIAIGSGGLTGKGWLHGTQSQLEFLPEKHTDFIFSVLGEEFGFFGSLFLLSSYLAIIIRGLVIASIAQNIFGKVMTGSLMLILFVYVFVNIAMVIGLLPVVGIPLPLISYGGSSLTTLMAGFGIIMSIHTHRKMLSKNL